MRRLVVLIMICLLPLRGWAGEVMTVQMAATTLAAQAMDGMPADCPMHAHAGTPAVDDGMPACGSCDLCLPIAEAAPAQIEIVPSTGHVQRASCGPAALSVAPAPTFKPPIS